MPVLAFKFRGTCQRSLRAASALLRLEAQMPVRLALLFKLGGAGLPVSESASGQAPHAGDAVSSNLNWHLSELRARTRILRVPSHWHLAYARESEADKLPCGSHWHGSKTSAAEQLERTWPDLTPRARNYGAPAPGCKKVLYTQAGRLPVTECRLGGLGGPFKLASQLPAAHRYAGRQCGLPWRLWLALRQNLEIFERS